MCCAQGYNTYGHMHFLQVRGTNVEDRWKAEVLELLKLNHAKDKV